MKTYLPLMSSRMNTLVSASFAIPAIYNEQSRTQSFLATALKNFMLLTAVLLTQINFADAAPPPTPVQSSDFEAQRAFVGDPLRGLDAGDAGNLFELNEDDSTHMASTTKSFTLLLAVEAVENGYVNLSDIVTISTKAATISSNHSGSGQNTHTEAGFPAGEQVAFEDLLYAMMLPSGGDASIAIGEHVVASTYPNLANYPDIVKEAQFTVMMNDRAEALGLTDTRFYNAYGGDHIHYFDNTAAGDIDHRATPRDMAIWFDFGMQYELFRDVAGFQGTYSFTALDGTNYSFNKSFAYPGVQGAKGGSGGPCVICGIVHTRRVNREIITSYTQSEPGDGTVLLDYGYASLFHPTFVAESDEWTGGWLQNDLTAVGSNRAASVVVRPNGKLRILLWGLDLNNGNITHLNPINVVGETPDDISYTREDSDPRAPLEYKARELVIIEPIEYDLAVSSSEPPTDSSDDIAVYIPPEPRDTPDSFDSGVKNPLVNKAKIIHVKFGNLIVIADTNQGVYIYAYAITQDNKVVLRDYNFVGTGTEGRVHNFNSSLIATAHRQSDGKLMLKTWRLDLLNGKLSNPLDSILGPTVNELQLSGWTGVGRTGAFNMVTASLQAGKPHLRNYSVNFKSGEITFEDSRTSGLIGSSLALTRVKGFGVDREIYGLAFRKGSDAKLVVQSHEIGNDMQITLLKSVTDPNVDSTLNANANIKIAGFDKEGVMIALQPDLAVSEQRLEVWSFDASVTSSTISPNRIASENILQDGLHALSYIPNDEAEGDFLIVPGTYAVDGIRVQGWRSAPRI